MSIFQLKSPISRITSNVSLLMILIIYCIMHNAPPKRGFVHVNNGSNSHQELKDFVHITCTTIQTLKNTKACLYGDTPRNSILREFSADGRFYCLWGHFVVSLRTADAFPVVASLPPKNREKRRPEMRLLFAGYL